MRVGERYSNFFCVPRFSSQSCRTPPTDSSEVMIMAVSIGSSIFLNGSGRGKFGGVIHFHHFVGGGGDAVLHAGRGGDQADIEFALEAFLHDFHVQQAEKSAAKAEAEGDGIFRLVEECGVVELQFSQGVAQHFVVAGVHREKPGEDHGLDGFEAWKWRRGVAVFDDGVTDAGIGDAFYIGDDEADVAGSEFLQHDRFRREHAEIFHFVDFVAGREANLHVRREAAFHHADEDDRAAVGIEPGIENQGAQRSVGGALRHGNQAHDGFENFFDAQAAFRADG